MGDRALGGFGLALAAFYIWAATLIPESFMSDIVGPTAFPMIIAAVIAICSIIFIVRPDTDPKWPGFGYMVELGFAAAVLFLYAQMLPEFGFLICTAVATAYLTWRLGSTIPGSLLTGVLTSVGIYVVFRMILGLSLAEGPLGI